MRELSPTEALLKWVDERRQNCLRIADGKLGEDRHGWLEDAQYFFSVHNTIEHFEAAYAWEVMLHAVTKFQLAESQEREQRLKDALEGKCHTWKEGPIEPARAALAPQAPAGGKDI